MLTFTLWPRSIVRIGLALLLTGLLTLGLVTLSAPGVAATSLVTTTAPADDAVAPESELLRVVLATNDGPMTIDHILFIEQNVVLPDYDAGALRHDDDVAAQSSADRALRDDQFKLLHDNNVAAESPTDRPLRYDEIKFLHDNLVIVATRQTPHERETATDWLGMSDLDLVDETRLHHLAPVRTTSIDESGLWILEEPGMQSDYGRDRVELIEALRAQNVADFDVMEQTPGLYTGS